MKEILLQFNQEIIDRLGNKHTIEVIYNPTETLTPDQQGELVTELTPVTGRGFLREDVHAQELYEDVANHVIDCDKLTVTRCGEEVSAFVAASFRENLNKKIYHLEGVIVEPEFRGSGLASQLLKDDLKETGSNVLAFHTQSAAMVRLGDKIAPMNASLAYEVAETIETKNQLGLIDIKRYGGNSLYGDTQEFSKVAIADIDWRHGDAIIFAGFVKK